MTLVRAAGLAAAALAIAGAAVAAFAPLSSNTECVAMPDREETCRTYATSLWDDERGASIAIVLIVAPLAAAIAAGALGLPGRRTSRAMLYAGAALLSAFVLVSLASIGLLLAPAALAAVVASAAGLAGPRRAP